ncbi:MAG: toprim domain-containing protein [Pseudomonadota bacterium]
MLQDNPSLAAHSQPVKATGKRQLDTFPSDQSDQVLLNQVIDFYHETLLNNPDAFGRKMLDNLRAGTPKHLYLPGDHDGVFNEAGLAHSKEVILCEALIDALTFWRHGFKNVTCSYGTNGFTDDHLALFKSLGIERVLIAYDRDDPGNKAAESLANQLSKDNSIAIAATSPKGLRPCRRLRSTPMWPSIS